MSVLWGVGCYAAADGRRVPWEIGHEEIQRDMGAAAEQMAAIGLAAGRRVLFCSMLAEAGQLWPLMVGAMLQGAQLSCADGTEGDAVRVAMFTRLMDYHAVLGVNDAILDGLDASGKSYADVFGRVAVLGARPGAYERLAGAGLTPCRFVLCGPAVAVAGEPGAPARVASPEWELGIDGDVVTVSNLRPRATRFDRTPTAVRGQIVDGGVVPRSQEEQP